MSYVQDVLAYELLKPMKDSQPGRAVIVPDNAHASLKTIVDEIKSYLDSHPNAADTIEGIIKWWWLRTRYEKSREEVQRAVDILVKHGVMKKKVTAGGQVIYTNVNNNEQ